MQRRYRKPKPRKDLIKKFRANLQIKAPQVFLIGQNGEQVGVIPLGEAINKAQAAELDLVEVGPKANPPVAKIMDYGQYKYELEKKIRKAKAHQKVTEIKSIRLSFRIKGQDLDNRRQQVVQFLEDGNKVKINLVLKGREKAHKAMAIDNVKKFVESLGPDTKIIQPLSAQGGQINVTVDK